MSICLTQGVTLLASTTEIKLVLSYQFNVGAPVWRDKASIYLLIALFFLIDLQMYLIYSQVESGATSGCI